jgi:hypothetical protein
MAKDQNTFAKRQREVERKQKAEQKRERRSQRKQKADELCEPNRSPSWFSQTELSVLSVFRKYRMTPGKMLCLGSSDLEAFNAQLAHLTDKGLLVAEKFRGGYSLTEVGFAAMKDCEQPPR